MGLLVILIGCLCQTLVCNTEATNAISGVMDSLSGPLGSYVDGSYVWLANTNATRIYVMLSSVLIGMDSLRIQNESFYNTSNKFVSFDSSVLTVTWNVNDTSSGSWFLLSWSTIIPDMESIAIKWIYSDLTGSLWKNTWDFGEHYCSWYGVGCDFNFSVTSLTLPENNLQGTFPMHLSDLRSLKAIDFTSNSLSGTLPDTLNTSLPQLELCRLDGNSFCGRSFPPECFSDSYTFCQNLTHPPPSPVPSPALTTTNETKWTSPLVRVNSIRGDANLVLSATYTKVQISGVIADIKIAQTYLNDGTSPIDVDYFFPLSPTACVYGMQFVNNGNLVVADVQKKFIAYELFNASKTYGDLTALLDAYYDNIIKISIANIPPQSILRVEIFYTEQLIPEEGIYQFSYPSVIPPLYSDDTTISSQQSSTFHHTFTMDISVHLPLSINYIQSPSHNLDIVVDNNTALTSFTSIGFTVDFVLQYSMSGKEILAGVLVYEPASDIDKDKPLVKNGADISTLEYDQNIFMAIIQTPSSEYLQPYILPREYIFVLDTSTSMMGYPTRILQNLVHDLFLLLDPTRDLFNIVSFSGSSILYSTESVQADTQSLKEAFSYISSSSIGGYSNLLSALEIAVKVPKQEGYSRIITVLTDGLIPVQDNILKFIASHLSHTNFYSFTIGSMASRNLTQGIATVGYGKEFWVKKENDTHTVAAAFIKHILHPVLTNITLDISPRFQTSFITPEYFNDVMSDRPIVISGSYFGSLPNGKLFTISGITGNGTIWQKDVYPTLLTNVYPKSLVYLWAGSRIRNMELVDQTDDITSIALQYNLLSPYTSFVGTSAEISYSFETATNLTQPLSGKVMLKRSIEQQSNCMGCCSCKGLCYPSTNSCGDLCPAQCPPTKICTNGGCESGLVGIRNNIFFQYWNDNCSNGCNSTSVCDTSTGICVNIVDRNTTTDCEGTYVGDGGFVCDNGNFIHISTPNKSTNEWYILDGNLAIEGSWDLSEIPIGLMFSAISSIKITSSLDIHPNSTITIDFKFLSIDEIPTLSLEAPSGIMQLPIFNADTVNGQFSNFSVINTHTPLCDKQLVVHQQAISLKFRICSDSMEEQKVINVVLGVVLGVLGLILLGTVPIIIKQMRKEKEQFRKLTVPSHLPLPSQ